MLLGYLYLGSNTDLEGFRHIFSCLLIIFTWKFHWPLKLVDFTPKMLLLLCFLCQKCICPSGWIILGSLSSFALRLHFCPDLWSLLQCLPTTVLCTGHNYLFHINITLLLGSPSLSYFPSMLYIAARMIFLQTDLIKIFPHWVTFNSSLLLLEEWLTFKMSVNFWFGYCFPLWLLFDQWYTFNHTDHNWKSHALRNSLGRVASSWNTLFSFLS